jgi:hypothetical protein
MGIWRSYDDKDWYNKTYFFFLGGGIFSDKHPNINKDNGLRYVGIWGWLRYQQCEIIIVNSGIIDFNRLTIKMYQDNYWWIIPHVNLTLIVIHSQLYSFNHTKIETLLCTVYRIISIHTYYQSFQT